MLFQRLAHTPFLCLILSWSATLVPVAAHGVSSDILNFVPDCAQTCFESYIVNNFDLSGCGNSAGLQCLCRQTGLTGHTIGEGAVACIVAEGSRGSCQGQDSSGEKVFKTRPRAPGTNKGLVVEITGTAYNMCVGVANAAPRTHPTIVATLIVPPGKGPLVAPTASRPSSSITTNLATDVTRTLNPTVVSPAPTSSSATSPPSGTSSPAVPEIAATTRLSPAQIVGITLGVIAVVVLGILLVLLARYVRRRRFGDSEEGGGGFTKMRDSLSFGRRSQPNSPPQLQISKPLQDGPFQWHMNRTEIPNPPEPAAIGLAVSPYRTQQTAAAVAASRAAQRIAPQPPLLVQTPPSRTGTPRMGNNVAKPTLSLAIPQAPPPSLGAQAGVRDSVVTEFAEDGEDRGTNSTGANIWRPPPTDPQSATTYFAADKGGNWVLRTKPGPAAVPERKETPRLPAPVQIVNTQVELPSPTDQTRAERAQQYSGWDSPGAVVQPLRVPSNTGPPKLGSPIAFKSQDRQQQQRQRSPQQYLRPPQQQQQQHGESRSSSVYSSFGVPQSVTPGPENPLPNAPTPDTYFALIRDERDLTAIPRTKRKSLRRPTRRTSGDSATSIESAAAPPFEDEDIIEDEIQIDLSPVIESPISPGKSPVRYPKIRRPASGQQQTGSMGLGPQLRLFPMPSRDASLSPTRRPVNAVGPYGLPANPSATRYHAQMRAGSPGLPANPSPRRNQNQTRGASPGLPANPSPNRNPRPVSPKARSKPVQQQYWAAQQAAREDRRLSPGEPYELPAEGAELKWRPSQQQQQQQQRQQKQQQLQPQSQPPQQRPRQLQPQSNRPAEALSPTWRPSQLPMQPAELSPEVAQGSLLAKRRGAAALALGSNKKPNNNKKGWKRESIEAPPITPGIRMMTPTRKGDDFILDVAR